MEQYIYTDLKWGIVTYPRGVKCLSDEPSTFHVVQSSALQFALQEDMALWVTKWRSIVTRKEKTFSFVGRVSCLGLAELRDCGKNSCRNWTIWVTCFRTGRERRQLNEPFEPVVTAWLALAEVSFKFIFTRIFSTLNKAYWVQHVTEGLRWKGSWIRLFA